jgi:hypothetical protein
MRAQRSLASTVQSLSSPDPSAQKVPCVDTSSTCCEVLLNTRLVTSIFAF